MKKNIYIILFLGILLFLGGVYLGFQKGKQSVPQEVRDMVQGQAEQDLINKELEITQEKCEVFLKGLYDVASVQNISGCDRYVNPAEKNKCQFDFIIPEIQETLDIKKCEIFTDASFVVGCQREVAIGKALQQKDVGQCEILPAIEIAPCITQSIDKIIQEDPDKKWCEELNDIDGPEKSDCLENIKIYKERLENNPNI